ncbi:hypothetical protein [Candidatus Mancarchaeum acidiphilum]|uniref:hypothetical protein n=1 Tax=Candidatus Mancarchaeum acidiphilum TaxID=1920749 RepID=UPI000B587AAA|nr:hypothetical protein [Candidatus Mancarchaeum acidiphilum]
MSKKKKADYKDAKAGGNRPSQAAEKPSKKQGIKLLPFYIAFFISIALYLVFSGYEYLSIILGLLSFIFLVLIIGLELEQSVREEGSKKVVIEIFGTIIVVAVIWLALMYGLNTRYPINVVPSCSMLPYLHRGDIIAISGISNIKQIKAPMVNVTKSEIGYIMSQGYPDSLSCVAYKYSGTQLEVSQYYEEGWAIGLYKEGSSGDEILNNTSGYPISYNCGVRSIRYNNGTEGEEAYLESIRINNKTIKGDANNSVVVYQTEPSDLFYKEGDSFIVHRAYAILNQSGNYYILTKGDNNPGLDMQYDNYPPNSSEVEGKVVGVAPYLGYLKLLISGKFTAPAGCNSTIIHSWES